MRHIFVLLLTAGVLSFMGGCQTKEAPDNTPDAKETEMKPAEPGPSEPAAPTTTTTDEKTPTTTEEKDQPKTDDTTPEDKTIQMPPVVGEPKEQEK